ncbi:Myb/SANT-like domain-containing protein [Hirschfeldia incana]|nr:Myb/SANT-like domain-containing protein [Hirschfeldia incana]
MNKVGKQNIMNAFERRFKKKFPDWKAFKNKYDTSRKKYIKVKMLTQNRTGLGFDNMGRIDMSDDWWNEREKECPGIRISVCKKIDNMDVFEAEFGGVVVTRVEELSAQHGEASLNSRVGGDDEADSHSGSSRAKRRRKEKDMVVEACDKQIEALVVKNKIAKQMLERQEASSVENVLEILFELPGVREWSPLYAAAIELLIDNEGNRRGFITMKTNEAKIKFLELRTKIKRDD